MPPIENPKSDDEVVFGLGRLVAESIAMLGVLLYGADIALVEYLALPFRFLMFCK